MCPEATKNIKVIMSDNNPKIYALEWEKQPGSEEYNLKVTPHDNPQTALEQAQSSTANHHCVSTVNPITGEGEEKK